MILCVDCCLFHKVNNWQLVLMAISKMLITENNRINPSIYCTNNVLGHDRFRTKSKWRVQRKLIELQMTFIYKFIKLINYLSHLARTTNKWKRKSKKRGSKHVSFLFNFEIVHRMFRIAQVHRTERFWGLNQIYQQISMSAIYMYLWFRMHPPHTRGDNFFFDGLEIR